MKKEIEAKLKSAISECDAHIKKLIRGKQLLGEYFPINLESFKCLEKDQIEHIDQFIYRFTKLQDSIPEFQAQCVHYTNYTASLWLETNSRLRPLKTTSSSH